MALGRFRRFLYRAASVEFVPCPACGRELRVDSVSGNAANGYWYLERPVGELESICAEQHGTDHQVPIRWKAPPTAAEWQAAKNDDRG